MRLRTRPLATDAGAGLVVAGTAIAVPAAVSGHTLPGQSTWWDRCGIVDGPGGRRFWSNLDPDQGTIAQPGNSGARCCAWEDVGVADVTIESTWLGDVATAATSGPMVCVNPDDPDYGLAFCSEPEIFGGLWVLWAIGRRPDQIRIVAATPGTHTPGVEVTFTLVVHGATVRCLVDGVEVIAAEIPEGLRGSTRHGVVVDANAMPGRPARVPSLTAPAVITPT